MSISSLLPSSVMRQSDMRSVDTSYLELTRWHRIDVALPQTVFHQISFAGCKAVMCYTLYATRNTLHVTRSIKE